MEPPTKPPPHEQPAAASAEEPQRSPPAWQTRRFRLMLLLVGAAILVGLLIKNQFPGWMASWNKAAAYQKRIEGKLDEALVDCNRALEWVEKDPDVYKLRAEIQLDRGAPKAALADYNELLELNPNYPQGYARRSFIYQLLGQQEEAIKEAQKAKEWWGPEVAEGLNYLAYARAVAGKDLDAALADANKALTLLRRDKEKTEKKTDKSKKKKAASQEDEAYASYLDTRGYAYLRKEQYEDALADFDKSIDVLSRFRDAYLEQTKGQADEVRMFNEKRLNANLGLLHRHRALTYEKLGKDKEAVADKEKAKQLGYDPKKHGL